MHRRAGGGDRPHPRQPSRHGKHVINVTVEADAFCGYALARKAGEAGVIYSMAYGDQPALTCDLVDWARTCGFHRDGGRARAQMAARVPQIDAGNGVGPLGCELARPPNAAG
jgi:hypothetical protein